MTRYSQQVFITHTVTGVEGRPDGLTFDIIADIPALRPYRLRDFIEHYLKTFFGDIDAKQHYSLLCHEPRDMTIWFHNTGRGKELATIFRLGHDNLDLPQYI